jgi:hypothetical protein
MPSETEQLYEAYRQKPGPDTLHAVVRTLKPTIQYSLGAVGALGDPLLEAKANLHAATAVERYDPAHGAALPTFVASSLRQLARDSRLSRSPVNLPDRVQLDAYTLHRATSAFVDQHGREPDTLELADATGLPVKRITKLRGFQKTVPSESQVGDVGQEGPDWDREALEYAYHDSDHTDRRILEMKTGYGGHPVLSPKETALRLKLTPSQLSRRSARLTARINKIRAALG